MPALTNMIKIEAKLLLRDSATVLFGVLFPTGLLLGLGAIPALRESSPETGGLRPIDIWAPTALVFAMVMIAVQHVPAVSRRIGSAASCAGCRPLPRIHAPSCSRR
ncbi:hypothetical protein [Micromonospora sp. C28ISP2-4]|uniref:hypothetical protein n=1 Tax=Micromonospora sp. C28ISP2-4 TaxID=3059523 RepID=UPI002674F99C|nr:hypothetical protein [Micromonospora sp. C28ISP2-4]MDO3687734.1 hypothetical protein [Micromonospora sp. C28ISP2-4]